MYCTPLYLPFNSVKLGFYAEIQIIFGTVHVSWATFNVLTPPLARDSLVALVVAFGIFLYFK